MNSTEARSIDDFAGVWQIRRQIEDQRGGMTGGFQGKAELRLSEGGWLWEEAGEIRYGAGAPLKAERRYLWKVLGAQIAVHFDDGRFFHAFDPASARPEALHFCDPDTYRAAYDLAHWPDWQVTWQVTGPRKDYRMVTMCTRE